MYSAQRLITVTGDVNAMLKENQDEIKKRQIKMKADEMDKRASAGNASGRDASVLATAALGAATGSTKKLLGE